MREVTSNNEVHGRDRIVSVIVEERAYLEKEVGSLDQLLASLRGATQQGPVATSASANADGRRTGRTAAVLEVVKATPGVQAAQIAEKLQASGFQIGTQKVSSTLFNLKTQGKVKAKNRKYYPNEQAAQSVQN